MSDAHPWRRAARGRAGTRERMRRLAGRNAGGPQALLKSGKMKRGRCSASADMSSPARVGARCSCGGSEKLNGERGRPRCRCRCAGARWRVGRPCSIEHTAIGQSKRTAERRITELHSQESDDRSLTSQYCLLCIVYSGVYSMTRHRLRSRRTYVSRARARHAPTRVAPSAPLRSFPLLLAAPHDDAPHGHPHVTQCISCV